MDIFIAIIISGIAVAYVMELLSQVINPLYVKLYATLPLSLGSLVLLGYWKVALIVLVPATAFVGLVLTLVVSKLSQVVIRRR